jgi:murein DD-endopeptidase MepM/ murein hydrolase activator NlpD
MEPEPGQLEPGNARHALGVLAFALSAVLAFGASQRLWGGGEASVPSEPLAAVALPEDPPTSAPDAPPAPAVGAVETGAKASEVPAAALDPQTAASAPSAIGVVSGRVERGKTMAALLRARGVSGGTIHELNTAMRHVFDFRRARPGDLYTLVRGSSGELLSFDYHRGRETVYRVSRDETGGLAAEMQQVPLDRRIVQLAGLINNSLFAGVTSQGESPDLVEAFADIFVYDIDFSTQVRPGDEFRMVFEKFYDRNGFVRYGKILAAEYRGSEQSSTALYFEDEKGRGNYFTPDGRALKRSFLRAPVNYSRISSYYSNARLHPVLKIHRPHRGVDYAAPTGTPVWAVADGTVIFQGWSGGFGRLVKLRHRNGYVTYYGHLSAFPRGQKVGQQVRQQQVIGLVGSTGLATGPHLDYRVQVNGRFVDPLKLKFPGGEPVAAEARERFERVKDLRIAALRRAQPALVWDASVD